MRILVLTLLLVACAPRGDHKPISEIYLNHKARLEKVIVSSSPEVKSSIEKILKLSEQNYKSVIPADLVSISEELEKLILSAGYTSRPALNEISRNFRNLAKVNNLNIDAVRLSLARLLSLLETELTTTGFKVK